MDESKKKSAVYGSHGRCSGHHDTGSSVAFCGVQGSVKRVSPQVDGAVHTGCGGSEQAGYTLPQGTERGLAGHVETGRPAGTGTELDEYENGGKRERIRERYDLLPPRAIKLVAIAMAEGAAKYGDHNWKGLPETNIVNHALRHIMEWLGGDRDEPHLSHAAANLLMLANVEEDTDDERRGSR